MVESWVVKWAQNSIVLFAKSRKPEFHKLQKLRKLRILIFRFLFEWISRNSDKMTIGKTRPTLVLVPGVSFLVPFDPTMKFKFGKFWKSRIQLRLTIFSKKKLQYNNFRNFRNCDLLENQIVLCCDCDRHSKNWIVLFAKLCFFRNRNSQFRNFRNPFYNPGHSPRGTSREQNSLQSVFLSWFLFPVNCEKGMTIRKVLK